MNFFTEPSTNDTVRQIMLALDFNKDYRALLEDIYLYRRRQNPAYSMRAFARSLELPVSRLSEALHYRRGLSATTARRIAPRLGLSPREQELFALKVDAVHARSKKVRMEAAEQVKALLNQSEMKLLSLDSFRLIANWYHLAILELTHLPDHRKDDRWIASKLGITVFEAQQAVARLMRMGLLKEEMGRWIATNEQVVSPDGIPSEAICRHHKQMLKKASHSLEHQSVEERNFSSTTFAMKKSDLPQVKKMLRKFRRDLSKYLARTGDKDSVYCLGMQFFRLDDEIKGSELECLKQSS